MILPLLYPPPAQNAVARITNLTDVAASVGYFTSNDTGATPVATVHFVKGSPYINIECDGADVRKTVERDRGTHCVWCWLLMMSRATDLGSDT